MIKALNPTHGLTDDVRIWWGSGDQRRTCEISEIHDCNSFEVQRVSRHERRKREALIRRGGKSAPA